jgi:acyl carrier protein
MDDARTLIRNYVLQTCLPGESPDKLRDDTMLREQGILDSLRLLKLVKLVEDTYGFEIDAHEVADANFGSVERIVSFIARRKA